MIHDVEGGEFDRDVDVLIAFHWLPEVEVFDVDDHKFGTGCGYHTVEGCLDGGEVGVGRTDVTFVDDPIATHGESDSFGFGFVRAESSNNLEVGSDSVGRFVRRVFNEKHCVRAGGCVWEMSLC